MAQLKDLIVNGPSRFIGDVYATTFTGDLNGNANTATSANTAAALTGKTLVTASAVTTSNWPTYKDNHIPTMSFMTYWNGAYSGTSSNLTYCAQGTIIGSNNIGNQSVKYATTSGSCSGNAATADRTKFLETFQQNSTTNTYGSQYPIWAQWSDSANVKLKCTNYTVWTDKATYATTAGSAPASDVKAWAKADTKPSYNATEVKLSNYSNPGSYSAISASDTVQAAIGKLEGAISGLESLLASI